MAATYLTLTFPGPTHCIPHEPRLLKPPLAPAKGHGLWGRWRPPAKGHGLWGSFDKRRGKRSWFVGASPISGNGRVGASLRKLRLEDCNCAHVASTGVCKERDVEIMGATSVCTL
ncbi:hypothetical protein SAMN05445850_8416 [Paraburkholderia tuberum]|uniref:Uncharacterized protein n=1 Tax=Paraburkholderia tuberum TaxID=157910 RepID=A0A1H1KLX7_9BURK|nr:hypothetical protein SAMN05445850_8416 [Paraburkholderia tuberum]